MKICQVCGRTEENFDICKYKDMILCRKHISQFARYGKFLENTIYDSNNYIIYDNYAEIILRDKLGKEISKTKVDLDDVQKCKRYKWHIKNSRNTKYAIATINEKEKIFLHRLILNYDGDMDIDHINHDGLDNRKQNLRVCSHSKNLTNQHNYNNGVYRVASGRYRSTICKDGKTIYIGTYDTEYEAIKARKDKEYKLFG